MKKTAETIVSILTTIGSVAKQAVPLSEMFEKMKDATGVTTVWTTFLQMLGNEITANSIEAIQDLVDVLSDPDLQPVLEAVSLALAAFAKTLKQAFEKLKPMLKMLRMLGTLLESANRETDSILDKIGSVINQGIGNLPSVPGKIEGGPGPIGFT